MAYTNIDDPSAFFHTQIWTGNSGYTVNVTNNANSGDFQPDLIWAKDRPNAYNHDLVDSSRGPTVALHPNTTAADYTRTQANYDFTSFDSNGFTTGAPDFTNSFGGNNNANGKVAWQWKANGGTTTSVSASGTGSGCVNACTHQANTTAGFSIITYTGRDDQLNNAQESKLTHGLGVAPTATIMKRRDNTGDWFVMGAFGGANGYPYSNNQYLKLNSTDTINGNYFVGDTAPDATHIFLGNEFVNIASATYVCYAFAEKQGYSKFDKYIGNGNVNGPFVYTGFKPAFVMIKANSASKNWYIWDNKRSPINPVDEGLVPNLDIAEVTGYDPIDVLSNGFKLRDADATWNGNGTTTIYMAFAENPFVTSTGIPTTAR